MALLKRQTRSQHAQQGTKAAPLPGVIDLFAPSALAFDPTTLTLGDMVGRVLIMLAYPPEADPAWLAHLFSLPGVVGSLHFGPTDPSHLVNAITRSITEFRQRLISGIKNELLQQQTEQSLRQAQELLRKIDQEQQRVFLATVVLLVLAKDQEELDKRVRRVEAAAAGAGMRARAVPFTQADGLVAAGPWAWLPADLQSIAPRHMPAETIAWAFPFSGGGINDGSGVLLGRDSAGGLVIVDIWRREGSRTNSNWTILAKPGAGKSFAVKTLLLREYAQGTKIIIIDPEREYRRICRELGGSWINCAGAAGRINPLQAWPLPADHDVSPDEDDDDLKQLAATRTQGAISLHLQTLKAFFSLYLRDLSDVEKALLQRAVRVVYERSGITLNTDPATVPPDRWPTMRELYEYIREQAQSDPSRHLYERLAVLLEEAATGADAALWAGPTAAVADADLIVLDVHDLQHADDGVRRAQYFNVLTWAWRQIEMDRTTRVLLVVDEAWLLVDPQTPQALSFLRDTSKRIRKYMGGLVIISQNVIDFTDPAVARHGQALLDNPSFKLLLAQGEKDLDVLTKLMNLSEAERDLLANARKGQGLLVAGNQRIELRIEAAPYELAIIDPDQARARGYFG
ncbi:VirB4 family type IV secretion system protein [Symbiobacterium terraclitae]|uniref:VirB4 family type IV secretion system protein n=1 Tax=Symbiobacterium terraclitae TaxID=557451 RepID=UPI0035B52AE1